MSISGRDVRRRNREPEAGMGFRRAVFNLSMLEWVTVRYPTGDFLVVIFTKKSEVDGSELRIR